MRTAVAKVTHFGHVRHEAREVFHVGPGIEHFAWRGVDEDAVLDLDPASVAAVTQRIDQIAATVAAQQHCERAQAQQGDGRRTARQADDAQRAGAQQRRVGQRRAARAKGLRQVIGPFAYLVAHLAGAGTGAVAGAVRGLRQVFTGDVGAFACAVGGVIGAVAGLVGSVTGAAARLVGSVAGAVTGIVGDVVRTRADVVRVVACIVSRAGGGAAGRVGSVRHAVTRGVGGVRNTVTGIIGSLRRSVRGAVARIVRGFGQAAARAFEAVTRFVRSLGQAVTGSVGGASQARAGAQVDRFGTFARRIEALAGSVQRVFEFIGAAVTRVAQCALGACTAFRAAVRVECIHQQGASHCGANPFTCVVSLIVRFVHVDSSRLVVLCCAGPCCLGGATACLIQHRSVTDDSSCFAASLCSVTCTHKKTHRFAVMRCSAFRRTIMRFGQCPLRSKWSDDVLCQPAFCRVSSSTPFSSFTDARAPATPSVW